MSLRSLPRRSLLFWLGFTLCTWGWNPLPAAIAQRFNAPPTGSYRPPRSTLPDRRVGIGSRGPCIQGSKELTALIPSMGPALTLEAYPTFFWFVPPSLAATAEFELLDDTDQELYQTTLPLTTQSGIVSWQLPSDRLPPLEVGKTYHWQFSMICSPQSPSANPFVEGWVQRVTPLPEVEQALQQSDPRTLATVYATAGIWHNLLSSLASQRQQAPKDPKVSSDWQTLMESIGLGSLAQEPLIPCCRESIRP
ncbi:DUF928 domain-containing protein [Neosynechococcus sphagnicola]|uniref:DUF928 domain-containing protein n=1 Tax=Neosynechococcus sphagnicola TaxID=1501145 RepID=UPI0006920A50|nr:DUF928 domain-containing protein [Neosynechococcus sphagnicola]